MSSEIRKSQKAGFHAVNVPFSANKRYVYHSKTCPFLCSVNIIYLFDVVLSFLFSISSENPDIIAVLLCQDFRNIYLQYVNAGVLCVVRKEWGVRVHMERVFLQVCSCKLIC